MFFFLRLKILCADQAGLGHAMQNRLASKYGEQNAEIMGIMYSVSPRLHFQFDQNPLKF